MKSLIQISPLLQDCELRKKPIIIRVTDFTEETALQFHKDLSMAHNTGQPIIPVIIDSFGGDVYALLSMISAVKHSTLPVATIVEGKAMSCGALLFSFGTKDLRFMDPDAVLMIHDISSMEHGKIEEIKSSAQEGDRLNVTLYNMMARNCNKADDYFLKLIHRKKHADWYLTAPDALKHDLASKLYVPSLSVEVSVDIKLE